LVNRLAGDIEDTTQRGLADWHHNGSAGVNDWHSTPQAVAGIHRDAAHPGFAEVLLDFDDDFRAVALNLERVIDFREFRRPELDIHDRSGNLDDVTNRTFCHAVYPPE
jgi:hypothetical protein